MHPINNHLITGISRSFIYAAAFVGLKQRFVHLLEKMKLAVGLQANASRKSNRAILSVKTMQHLKIGACEPILVQDAVLVAWPGTAVADRGTNVCMMMRQPLNLFH